MFLAPTNVYEKLEFDKIIELLQRECSSTCGIARIEQLTPFSDRGTLEHALSEVEEMHLALSKNHHFPLGQFPDVSETLRYLRVEGFVLSVEQLQDIHRILFSMYRIGQFFGTEYSAVYPKLFDIIRNIEIDKGLLKSIDAILDEKGEIRADASPELVRIRKERHHLLRELDKRFRAVLGDLKQKGWLADTEESYRNGRRVLSITAENKRQVKGIIHDESATGKTAYVEPEAIIEVNNDLFDLEIAERREIYRILRELSQVLRPYTPRFEEYQDILTVYDVILAKARLALLMKAAKPHLTDTPHLGIVKAYHPLLYLKNREEGKKTIPFTLRLLAQNRILVLSGPNAGGKSVLLKSVGLLQLMLQCGLLIPADPQSEFGLFDGICIDIGDQQSLEDELSTYSSRLRNMKQFLDVATPNTLILIDEFGSGTDPAMGGAIAETILRELNKKEIFGVITTHFSNLKLFAFKNKGIVNGCMVFDKDTLSPTYQMIVGKPGSSYAFEIAQKVGLDADLLAYARRRVGETQAVDELLVDLQRERQELAERNALLEAERKNLDKLVKSYDQMSRDLEFQRKKFKLDVKATDLQQKTQANKDIERVLREIKEERNEEKARQLQLQLKQEREKAHADVHQLNQEVYYTQRKAEKPIEVGDWVRLRTGGDKAHVERIQGSKAVVIIGQMRLSVPLHDLAPADAPLTSPTKGIHIATDSLQQKAQFVPKLDIRGMRREDALIALEHFIDAGILASQTEIRIIHGKGNGILRQAALQKIKEYKNIQKIRHEEDNAGGDGVTIIEL
jgi:DNA mismatch repair protein MutS2